MIADRLLQHLADAAIKLLFAIDQRLADSDARRCAFANLTDEDES